MARTQKVVGVTHPEEHVSRFFTVADLQRLREAAEVRVLGKAKEPGFCEQLGDVNILLGAWGMAHLDEELLAAAPQLEAVCYAAGSVKGFVTPASYQRGITITTAMHANAIPVAEVSVALIILANKRWFSCQDQIRQQGREGHSACYGDKHPGNFETTVGLIGCGAIGREVLKRLRSYDLRVLVYDPYADAASMAELGGTLVSLDTLVSESSVVSLHAPNIPATKHMINAKVLAAMADGATFINTARGALVDEDALVHELQRGRIYAMLDVTDPEPPAPGHPFYTLPNCWLTPHRAGSTAGEVRRMGSYAIADCLRILNGEEPRYPVSEDMLATMA